MESIDMEALERAHDPDICIMTFDVSHAKTPRGAAYALASKLNSIFEPGEGEIQVYSPAESKDRGMYEAWTVVWEGGPFEWAVRYEITTHELVSSDLPWSFSISFFKNT